MPQSADVFISYSREDKESVLSLAAKLREAGVSLWIDQGGIDAATIWGEEIVNAIEQCKVLLLMISESSATSQNVMREVMLVSEKKKHILPVHLTPTAIPATLKYPLAGIQHVEYFRGSPEENLKTIIRSLERIGVTIKPPELINTITQTTQAVSHSTDSAEDLKSYGNSIAVLPFENMSSDKESDYLSDGLTDELITNLSKINELQVISRILSVQYKGENKDPKTIGRELHARYLVAGSVRKHQDNLRISAQLIDIATGRELWAEKYKGTMADVFDFQENVSSEIAEALKVKLSVYDKVTLTKRSTVNVEAYDLYLRGKDLLYRFTRKSIEFATQLFEQAIELDPRYSEAYAACAESYGQLSLLYGRKEELYERALELSLKALLYNPMLAEAYAALGLAYFCKRLFDDAKSASEKAFELDADNFLPYWILGRIHITLGQYQEALQLFEKVSKLNRSFYTIYSDLDLVYHALGLKDKIDENLQRRLEFFPNYLRSHPDDARGHILFASALAQAGKTQNAAAQLEEALQLSPGDALMLYNAACVYTRIGEMPSAIRALKEAVMGGYEFYDWIKRDSALDGLRNEPEYIELMKDK